MTWRSGFSELWVTPESLPHALLKEISRKPNPVTIKIKFIAQ